MSAPHTPWGDYIHRMRFDLSVAESALEEKTRYYHGLKKQVYDGGGTETRVACEIAFMGMDMHLHRVNQLKRYVREAERALYEEREQERRSER